MEITANDNDVLGEFSFGVALVGTFVDNVAAVSPNNLNFAARDIDDATTNAPQTVVIVNSGKLPLDISRVSIVGNNPGDFQISGAIPTNVPIGGTNFVQVVFRPQAEGAKSAQLRIESIACSNAIVDVALNGTATSTLHHFGWETISSPQNANVSFSVKVFAQDRNNDTVADFTGTANLSGEVGIAQSHAVLISEIDPGTPDAIEFVNVSAQTVNVSGWRVTIYDETSIRWRR